MRRFELITRWNRLEASNICTGATRQKTLPHKLNPVQNWSRRRRRPQWVSSNRWKTHFPSWVVLDKMNLSFLKENSSGGRSCNATRRQGALQRDGLQGQPETGPDTISQHRPNAGPASATLTRHWDVVGKASHPLFRPVSSHFKFTSPSLAIISHIVASPLSLILYLRS